jgi:hypothetical protein
MLDEIRPARRDGVHTSLLRCRFPADRFVVAYIPAALREIAATRPWRPFMPPLRLARLRLLLLLVVLPGMAWAEDRWALVIGVSTYESDTIPSLRNTVNDARTVAAALDNMGFEVYYLENAARDEVEATVRDIAEEQGAAELGLVYFAGHGLQVEGQNYLLPSDVRAEGDDFLRPARSRSGRSWRTSTPSGRRASS